MRPRCRVSSLAQHPGLHFTPPRSVSLAPSPIPGLGARGSNSCVQSDRAVPHDAHAYSRSGCVFGILYAIGVRHDNRRTHHQL